MKVLVVGTLVFLILLNTAAGENGVQYEITREAESYLGTPYVYAGADSNGVDCSGLVYCVFGAVTDFVLPRRVEDLILEGVEVEAGLFPGDLVFFDTDEPARGRPSHVGISLGGNQFIHAASAGLRTGVIVSDLDENYYSQRFVGAKRLFQPEINRVTVRLDSDISDQTLESLMMPGIPVRFSIQHSRSGTEYLEMKVFRGETFLFSKRIRTDDKSDNSNFWFIPQTGRYTVRILQGVDQPPVSVSFVSGVQKS